MIARGLTKYEIIGMRTWNYHRDVSFLFLYRAVLGIEFFCVVGVTTDTRYVCGGKL